MVSAARGITVVQWSFRQLRFNGNAFGICIVARTHGNTMSTTLITHCCVSFATMVTRTRHNVTLCVLCLRRLFGVSSVSDTKAVIL